MSPLDSSVNLHPRPLINTKVPAFKANAYKNGAFITVSDDDVQDEFEAQKKQAGIKNQKELDKVLEERDLTEQDVLDGIRDQLVQDALLAEAAPGPQTLPEDIAQLPQDEQIDKLAEEYDVTDDDIQTYYSANPAQFQSTESATVEYIEIALADIPRGRRTTSSRSP